MATLTGDERFAFDSLSTSAADVRHRRARAARRAVRGGAGQVSRAARRCQRRRPGGRGPEGDLRRAVQGTGAKQARASRSRAIRGSSSRRRSRPSSARGTASARSTTATRPASPHDLGTAVNIQTMVFGNMGEDSGTGVVTTRNVTTGENEIEGDYLMNAQGEDVVAGTRATNRIATLARAMPRIWREFTRACTQARAALPARCRTSSSRSSAASCGCCRRATPSARRRRRCASPSSSPTSGGSPARGGAARHAGTRRLLPAPAVRARGAQGGQGQRRADRLRPQRVAGRGHRQCSPSTPTPPSAGPRREESRDHGAARDQARRRARHARGAGHRHHAGGRTSHAALVARQFGKPAVVGVTR